MGSLCVKEDAIDNVVHEVQDGELDLDEAGSKELTNPVESDGYRSRCNSVQRGPLTSRLKYLEESEEEKCIRLRVFEACLSGHVGAVETLIQEFGEICLDLRCTSLADDGRIEPLVKNVDRYRRPRIVDTNGGDTSVALDQVSRAVNRGMATPVTQPPSGKEVMEKSMGTRTGQSAVQMNKSVTARPRRQIPDSAKAAPHRELSPNLMRPTLSSQSQQTAACLDAENPPPLTTFRAAFQASALEEQPPLIPANAPLPHAVPSGQEQSVVGASAVVLQPFTPGLQYMEVSLAPSTDLAAAAAAAAAASDPVSSSCRAVSIQPVTPTSVTSATHQAVSLGTPLIWAASIGSRELVSFLLMREQDINEVASRTTALITAVRNAQPPEFVKFLIGRGSKVHVGRGALPKQALHYASEIGNPVIVRLLLTERPPVNWLSKDGYTALHFATRCGFTDIVKTLLDHGADPSIRETISGLDCLEIASNFKFSDILIIFKHQKRLHPTQYGATTLCNPGAGYINGTSEFEMSRMAKESVASRSQMVKDFVAQGGLLTSPGDLLNDKKHNLNPALSAPPQLLAVPANPPVQSLHLERHSLRASNPNNLAASLLASQHNPPPKPLGNEVPKTQSKPLPAGFSLRITEDGGLDLEEWEPKPQPAADDTRSDTTTISQSENTRSSKALFHQHGWSEKQFHTNMSRVRARPQSTEVIA